MWLILFSFVFLFFLLFSTSSRMILLAELLECLMVYGKACPMIAVMAGTAQNRTVVKFKIYPVIDMAWDNMVRLKILFASAGPTSTIPFKQSLKPLILLSVQMDNARKDSGNLAFAHTIPHSSYNSLPAAPHTTIAVAINDIKLNIRIISIIFSSDE